MMKKIITCLLAIMLAFSMVFCVQHSTKAHCGSAICMCKDHVTMKKKQTKKLYITVRGCKVTKGVKWSSSNKKIATVSSKGKVTAKKKGKATITAKYSGVKTKCKVTVK